MKAALGCCVLGVRSACAGRGRGVVCLRSTDVGGGPAAREALDFWVGRAVSTAHLPTAAHDLTILQAHACRPKPSTRAGSYA